MAVFGEISWIALLSLSLFYYTGFGVARLLSFERIRGAELLIAPFVGLAVIVAVGYWCGGMGWSATTVLAVTLIVSTMFNLVAVLKPSWTPLEAHGLLLTFAIAAVTFIIAVFPLLRAGWLGPIGSNGDQIVYTNMAAYLEHNGLPGPSPDPSKPAIVQLSFINWGHPLGFHYVHASIDKLTGFEPYETFSVVTALLTALHVLAYTFLARYLFALSSGGQVIISLLVAMNPLLLGVHLNNYGMHVMNLGLIPLFVGMAALALEEPHVRALFLPALLLSATFTSYPIATVPFALAPLAVYGVLLPCTGRCHLISTAGRFGIIVALAAVLNALGIFHIGKGFLMMVGFTVGREFGDVHDYVPWAEAYGLTHHLLPQLSFPQGILPGLSLVLGAGALLLTSYGVCKLRRNAALFFLSLSAVYLPFILWLRFVLQYPYGFFKAMTFIALPAAMMVVFGAERVVGGGFAGLKGLKGWKIALPTWGFLACLLGVNLANSVLLSKIVQAFDLSPYIALRNVRPLAADGKAIHIRDDQGTDLLWITYFLQEANLSLAHHSPYYLRRDWPFYRESIDADFVLTRKDVPLRAPWAVESVYENDRYKLLRKDRGILTHIDVPTKERLLRQGEALEVEVLSDRVVVGDRSFSVGGALGRGAVLRLGISAPAGALVRLGPADQAVITRLGQDVSVLNWPIQAFPSTIGLTNVGRRPLLFEGWLEFVEAEAKWPPAQARSTLFERYREEVIPGSGFFSVDGWHALEDRKRRWTQGTALSIFRNPHRSVSLTLEGVNRHHPGRRSPANVAFRLNGYTLGEVNTSGAFRQQYLVSAELLGPSAWGELEIAVSHTFNPRQLGLSTDPRDLGVLLTDLNLYDLELAADGLIDFGTHAARRHLGPGWSNDEQAEGLSFVWANAQESQLWVSIAQPRACEMDMRVVPFRNRSSAPQELKVYVNERHVQDIILEEDEWRTFSVRLPASFLSPGLNIFRFAYRYVASPAEVLPGNQDPRRLALAFDFIRLRLE